MKNKLFFIACCTVSIVCLCAMSSCNMLFDEPLIGGDPLSKDRVAAETGPWTVEEITESPDGVEWERDSGGVMEGKLFFYRTKSEALLIDSNGSLTWLYSENKEIFESFNTGDYVRVGHGYIMESYPGQTYISQIAIIEDGDVSSLTEEDWDKLEGVFVDLDRDYAVENQNGGISPLHSSEDIMENDIVDNDSGAVSEGRLYFPGNKDKALLIDSDGGIMWLYASDKSIFAPFDSGDKVRVSHGAVMMSYPGQTNISAIELIEDGDVSDFTDEELERLEIVKDGFN